MKAAYGTVPVLVWFLAYGIRRHAEDAGSP